MGRPPKPASERRSAVMHLRVTRAELRTLRAEAKRRGVSVADLLMGPWRSKKGGR